MNFGSYKSVEFDFQNQGLTLIAGPTGAGKSTLMDATPWCMFGGTAKGGNVDEVCSWNSKEKTYGVVYLEGGLEIHRARNPNDLYIIQENDTGTVSAQRGKDLKDTQKLIDNLLGIDYDTYLAGAYFHEFSQTAQFFTTTAKIRRQICEQIVDLSMAKKLTENISKKSKELEKTRFDIAVGINELRIEISTLECIKETEEARKNRWEIEHKSTAKYITDLYNKFESNRKQTISKKCSLCKTILEHPYEVVDTSENPYLERLEEVKRAKNPYKLSTKNYSDEIAAKSVKLAKQKETEESLNDQQNDLDILQDVTAAFRSTLIINTIEYIENSTNDILSRHFDAEIQVSFNAADNDKLEVLIYKDGNEASFTQLSKGQRQLLKLAFGVSVMKGVSNHKGVHFSQIFFDEALDGLDETLKIKAYDLLQELSKYHESVFVVEHSEALKAMFENSYSVRLENGQSQIEKN